MDFFDIFIAPLAPFLFPKIFQVVFSYAYGGVGFVSAGAHLGQMPQVPPLLELQAIVSHLAWVLEAELGLLQEL